MAETPDFFAGVSTRRADVVAQRDALAAQLAHEWGWPAGSGSAVLDRLFGDRTTMLNTFTEEAARLYLGAGEEEAHE